MAHLRRRADAALPPTVASALVSSPSASVTCATSPCRPRRHASARPRGFAHHGLLWLSCLAQVLTVTSVKSPVVKWGQKSDRLYVTIPLVEVSEPELTMEDRRIYFKGISRGEEYEVNMKLLRPINVTESKHEINKWSIVFDLQKERKEPCWKRLLKSKKTVPWLKKDQDKWFLQDCQQMKEQWREAYFGAKLRGEDPSQGKKEKEPEKPPAEKTPGDDPIKKKEKEDWEKMVKQFRDKAVPRKRKTSKQKGKKADKDKDEL
mmetsp:Transcript_3105/g.5479  ORF Transcript_3105/g.5479 Transcript_3105/m.5479 type:complete len:262 (-) Transcript_3105:40-825(-)